MRVTTKDIARICGVSRASVDRAINDRAGINARTKEKILRVSDELGYRPHLLARGLVTGKTMSVGVVLFDLAHHFYSELATAVMERAKAHGYFAYVALSDKDKDEELRWLDRLASLKVDGLLLVSINRGREFDQFLSSLHIPVVTMGNALGRRWPFVGIDDRGAAYEAVQHIVRQGYTRVVYVSSPLRYQGQSNIYAVEQRHQGYREAVRQELGADQSVVIKDRDYLAAIDALDLSQDRTAILCSSDIFALRILNHFQEQGVRVPDDVGLMGFDNIDTLQFVRPKLATVDYHIHDIGHLAFDLLLKQMEDESAGVDPITTVQHQIVAGATL